MSRIDEITVPQTKPATEWVRGRAVQKVSPQQEHALAQSRITAALLAWADRESSGWVGTEWEFRVTPPHEATRPLVPDVAFLSYARLPRHEREAAQIPYMAPDAAFEILSPDDRAADVRHKIEVYLASGCSLVVIVDPAKQTFDAHDASGAARYAASDVFSHAALPGFSLLVASAFEIP